MNHAMLNEFYEKNEICDNMEDIYTKIKLSELRGKPLPNIKLDLEMTKGGNYCDCTIF